MLQANQRHMLGWLGRVFTFAVRSVKQFSFQSTPETTERLSWPTVVRRWVPDIQLFTGRMPFLLSNQHCQSTEGKYFFTYYTYFIFRDKMCIICVFYHFITGCKVQLNYSANRLTDDPCWEALEGFNWNKPWCLPLTLATNVHTQL